MKMIISQLKKKTNGIIFTLIGTGIILLMLGVLIVWRPFVLQLTIGLVVIVVAYAFFYGAYKIWSLKKDLEKILKLKL